MNRALKYINSFIAVLLAAAAACVYWFAWRALPVQGEMRAPVSAPVTVKRDAQGVPHIEAATDEDAWFAQGYVQAQDRLFQLEMARRRGSGDLAEVLGRVALEADLESRRLRLRRVSQAHARNLAEGDRPPLAAYARGVNHFIETHRGRLPVEFRLLRFDPAPWTIADSLLVGLLMFRDMTNGWRNELMKRNLLEGGEAEKVRYLFPVRTGGELEIGSNAWAISGRYTRSGKPILASDPHLGYSLPSVWYQVHLKTPRMNVAGVGLPGLPGVGIGHNQEIAWGITNLGFDVQDLFLEKVNLAAGVALYQNRIEPLRQEREIVRIRRGAPVEAIVTLTRHGPLVLNEQGVALSLRWVASEPGLFEFPFPELNRARNWGEFRKALARHHGPGFNFVYADRQGNIGYQVAGRLPRRPGPGGDLPFEGWTAGVGWTDYIPFDDLPSAYNPESGRLVTANQNPFPEGYKHPVAGHFATHYRQKQIHDLLERKNGWTAPDMLGVQKDVYSQFSHYLARAIVEACRKRNVTNPDLKEAIALLAEWNGQMEAEQAAPLVVTLAYQQLRSAVADRAGGGKGSTYDYGMGPAALEQLLRARPSGWFPDYDQVLVKSLLDGVEGGVRLQGREVRLWRYGRYNELVLKYPVVSEIPWLGKYLQVAAGLSGSSSTVNQVSRRSGPSMRFVADLADWDNSLMNIVTGQSGQVLSGHHHDQWEKYLAGESFRMQFDRVEAKRTLKLIPGR